MCLFGHCGTLQARFVFVALYVCGFAMKQYNVPSNNSFITVFSSHSILRKVIFAFCAVLVFTLILHNSWLVRCFPMKYYQDF